MLGSAARFPNTMVEFAQKESSVRIGEVLAGKYLVERVLGMGGMGVVVAAMHLELDERVALKLLLPALATDPSAVARFAREARASVKIKSEHVARTFDVGRLENGSPFMVMEYLEGADLAQRLEQRGPLPVMDAVDFIIQALDAVADAHVLGIIHRDIKPSNLFVVRQSDGLESVKVLDFGLSKMSGVVGMRMTHTAVVMGSPCYMSVLASALLPAAEGADAAVSAPACAGAETVAPSSQTCVRRIQHSHHSLLLLCTASLVAVAAGAYAWWRVAVNVSPRTVRTGESIVHGGPVPTPPEVHPAGAASHQSGQFAAGELSVPSRAVLEVPAAPVASARPQPPARQSQRGDARRAREDSVPAASAEMQRAPAPPSAKPPSGGITDYGDRT